MSSSYENVPDDDEGSGDDDPIRGSIVLDDPCLSSTSTRPRTLRRILLTILILLILALIVLLIIFVLVPLFFIIFPEFLRDLFFLTFVRQLSRNYTDLSVNGLTSLGSAFYLTGDDGVIGVWHTLPVNISNEYRNLGVSPTENDVRKMLSRSGFPVVFYLHGNSFDRTHPHRVGLSNLLNDMNYHVVTFDYRGFGDSPGTTTTVFGMYNDSLLVYKYIRNNSGSNTIIVWGHSMGTAMSTQLVVKTSRTWTTPHGLILEGAFNNLKDAFMDLWFSFPVQWMPDRWVEALIVRRLLDVGLTMLRNDRYIKNVTCPILMLHAEDDPIVDVELARRLRDVAVSASRDIQYIEFEASRGYNHEDIFEAPELHQIIPLPREWRTSKQRK